jgi:hypothetical protein
MGRGFALASWKFSKASTSATASEDRKASAVADSYGGQDGGQVGGMEFFNYRGSHGLGIQDTGIHVGHGNGDRINHIDHIELKRGSDPGEVAMHLTGQTPVR